MKHICTLDELTAMRPNLQDVILIGGVFDLLHSGHIDHLMDAKNHGRTLIVHVASDKRVRQKKGPSRPINNEHDRARLIASIRYVDYVFIGDFPHYEKEVIEKLKPDVLMLNYEAVSPKVESALKAVAPLAKIVITDTPKVLSTTKLIDQIERSRLML